MTADLKPYPAYKDSGVPWLAQVPEHWVIERLDRLFRLRSEEPLDSDQRVTAYLDGRVTLRSNVVGQKIKGVVKEAGWQRVHPGDFAISGMNAHLGGMGVSDSLGKCSPIYLVLRPKEGTNAKFVSHLVRRAAHSGALKALVNTIRFNSADFKREDLKSIWICVPPPDEQSAIVRFLDHADRRIRRYIWAKQKLIKLLEEQKQAIIHRAVTRGLDPNVRLKPSGVEWLGEVPEHWEVRKLGQIAVSFRTGPFGSILHQSDYVEGGTPVINPTHMSRGSIIEDSRCSVPPEVAVRLSHYRLDKYDLVFSRRGELGRCAIVRDREVGWLCGTGSIRVRVAYDGIEPEYLIQALQVRWVGEYLSLFSVGATMDSLNTGILKGVLVLVPPAKEQRQLLDRIANETRSIDSATADARRDIDLIREYRTRLTADVVTGKLDVREAAAKLPEEPEEPEPLAEAETLESDEEGEGVDLETAAEEAEV
jgi:type I restriction enzyme S subunit